MNIEFIKNRLSLDGKIAIVTGASQGIGKGIAVSLANFGADVIILGRDAGLLKETQKEIGDLGRQCEYAAFDISVQANVDTFFDEYRKTHDKLDIYVSNAAYTIRKSALDTTSEEMSGLWDTNVKGSLFGLQRAAAMMKEKRKGNIVLVTSVNALNPLPSQGVYSSTKYALEGLMRCLASDLAQYNIRVNSLAPGGINTHMNKELYNNREMLERVGKQIPLGRIGEIDEMGDVVACMVSDAFRYMTGSTVLVDGGLSLRMA